VPANKALHQPILVGIGTVMQKEEDARRALEPLALMEAAVRKAGSDCGCPTLLTQIEHIAVPKGRWQYSNPAGAIGCAIGSPGATTTLATVGVLQQSLIGDACRRIIEGEIECALVIGGDAGYRLLRARLAGIDCSDSQQDTAPDIELKPHEELRHPSELRAGLKMPAGLYAIMESAFRAANGLSVDAHRDRIAVLYSRFSEIAEANPHAWRRHALTVQEIRNASERNPMQAFPYTKLLCSSWNVDQAAALLFCSIGKARALGIPEHRWIYPVASTESNNMVPVSARAQLHRCPGAQIAGSAALEAAGIASAALDHVELYSCFPLAVEIYAAELGIDTSRDLTVTGGMSFAGGPYNNYVLQSTCRMAGQLREDCARNQSASNGASHNTAIRRPHFGLVSSVSGVLTKQGFGLWSDMPGPGGLVFADCSDAVKAVTQTKPVVDGNRGLGTVVGYTVLHEGAAPACAVVLAEIDGGRRALATTHEAQAIARLEHDECCGTTVRLDGDGRFSISDS
jgi:acetyl-CoA C-acetyltransferase